MIKNSKQAASTRNKLKELRAAKEKFELEDSTIKGGPKHRLGVQSFNDLINDLENQIAIYESLTRGNFHCLQPKSLQEIPNILIAARLAQKISQKKLGELIGVSEQQIQRYESTDYETASWTKIIEVATALGLKFHFEKTIILNSSDNLFEYPNGTSPEQAERAANKIRAEREILLIQ